MVHATARVSWLRGAARSWLLAPLVTMLVASLLVAVPSGVGAVSDGRLGAPGSSSAPSTIQAGPLPSLTTPQPGSSFDLSSFDSSSGGIPLEEVAPPAEAAKATRAQDEVDPVVLSGPALHADTVAVSYAPGAAPAVSRYSVSLDDDGTTVAVGLALGMPVTVSGGVSGDAFSVVDGVGDTFVEVGGSWSVVVDLGDAFELSSVGAAPPSGGVLGGVVVSGRLGSSGVWTEFGRAGAGGGSVSVTDTGLFRYVRVVPVTALASGVRNRVGEVAVWGFEGKSVSDFDPALSGSLSDAGFSSRLESWSFSDGALSPDSGSASVLVADLCSGCDLGHEALVEATVRMLVEFPAANPRADNSANVNLSVGLEEGTGRRRGVTAGLYPWMTFDRGRNRGPLQLGMYCGGGGSGGADRLRAEGVNLGCTGGVVEDVVDHTTQNIAGLAGGEVWVELEYRNLKLWLRVWDKDDDRPVLPQAGMAFGPAHHTGDAFNTDEDWVLNPARLVIRSWGWDNGKVKVKDVEVTGMVKGPRRSLARGSSVTSLDVRGRYSPLGRVVVDLPVYETDKNMGFLPEAVVDGNPEYVSIYDKAWELAYTRMRRPSSSQPWYRTWMDEAFLSNIYQWDMASMMWFAKYMHKGFDAMGSMDIYYQAQRDDGGIARRMRERNGSGLNPRDGEVNPPLFVWAEWQSFRLTGDLDRVRRVLPAVREYIDWYSIVRWAQSSDHQLYWNEMRGSGNETLPRPYREMTDGGKEWGDPDHSGMMAQAYLLLGELYDTAGDTAEAADMRAVGEAITDRINRYMWKTFRVAGTTYGQWFYVNADGDIAPTSGAYVDEPQTASLWVMMLGVDDVAKREQVKRLLDSEDWYNTDVPLGTLPKSHSQYQGWGDYGLGQVMSPYTYAVIKGAEQIYGYEYAQGFSEKYLDGIAEVYEYSDTIWEFYAPSKQTHTDITNARFYASVRDDYVNGRAPCPTGGDGRRRCEIVKTGHTLLPGNYAAPSRHHEEFDHRPGGILGVTATVKPDFVGWGGIGPIALLIENVIGIQPDSIDREITWHLTRTDRHGLNNLWLGGGLGKIDLIAAARTDSYSPAVITVTSANADTTTATTAILKIIHPSYEDCTTVHVITLNQANQRFTSHPCPGVGLSAAELVVAEGGTVSYMVRLATEPTADVTVTVSGQAGTDVSLSGLTNKQLTFTAGNWDTSQTVTVTAAQDTDAGDDEVTLTHTAADYAGLASGMPVTVDDDDTAGLAVSRTGLSLAEGATGTYTVALATEPSADVTVTISGQAGTDVSLSGLTNNRLTFTAGNWDTPQTVTVTAAQDPDAGDEEVTLTHTAASADADYAGLASGMPVTVDDTAGLVVSRTGLSLPEESVLVSNSGQSGNKLATYSRDHGQAFTTGNNSNGYAVASVTVISEDPDTHPIDLQICEVDEGGVPTEACTGLTPPGSFARGSLVFTVPDVSPLTLAPGTTYMAVFKALDTGEVRVAATSSDGEDSASLPGWSIRDRFQWNSPTGWQDSRQDNAIRIDISGTVAGLVVAEGATGTYTVALATEPSADVTVTISGQAGTDVSLSGLTNNGLTFTTGNWDTSQTVTVTAAQDTDAVDDVVTLTHTAASTDTDYAGLALGMPVTVDDDDTAVWSVTAEPARVVEGAESTITVSAGKAFEVAQTITLAAGGTAAGSDYSLSSSSLTLDAGDTSVTASVTAVDDGVIEGGDETVVVTAAHDGGAVGSATVTVEDNDTAVWSVTAEPARVVEGAESTITVSAGKAFAVDQTITLAAGGTAAGSDYSLSSSSLTLHAGDTSVTASVTAVDDSDEESDEESDETVVVTASHSGDAVGSATVTIEDNDTPVWSVTAEPARVVEGAESTITVSAGKAFEVDQTITLAAGGTAASEDYSLSSSLTLHAGDTSVTATVTAVDDSDEESDETVVVTASHSGDAVGSATVTIEDNDTPVSTVAALSSLALSGVSIGVFDADTTAYAASVGNGVSSTTVTAVASDDGASVVIADGDGETQGTSRSVSLVVGDNEITVTVTAEDAATAKTYTITVARAVAPLPPGAVWGDRLADRDIALPGARSSSGVWSNGTDVWVLTAAGRISVYSLADGAEHTDRGFALPGGAEYAAGLWSNGATLWVADVNRGWVRAYRLSDGVRQADRDLDVGRNREPAGIWSDGTTMWVADFTDSRVYAYDLATKARVADKELDLDKNPGEAYNPFGIWSNGDTLLAASWFRGEIIAHSLADGQRQPAKDLSTFASRTNSPNGIWSNGHILWVVDSSDATLYAYAVPGLGAPPDDTPVWSVTADPARVAEGQASTVTVSVDKAFETAQTIMLAAGGTAAGSDYSLSSSSLTLHAGDTSVTATVTAVDDSVIEGGDETVVVTASHGGETVGSATVTVEDNDTATWSVTAEPARVAEGAESTITVSVDKAFEVDQTIMLAAGGTAAGSDYSLSSSSLTLHAGDTSVTASVTAVDDGVIEGGDETVVVTAAHSGDAVGSATVTVEDNDTPTWSVTAEPARVAEGAESTITVSAGKAFAVAQTIMLAAGGTAAGSDYSLSSSSLTLHAGDTSVTATVTAVDDGVIEGGDETVVVTASHSGDAVGSATVTVEDSDTATWSVTAEPARVAEGAESTITVSAGKAFEVDQTITLAAGGTAAGSDYSLSSSSSTLHAGDTSVTATVTAVDDSDEESDETVVVTASHGGAVGSATVTIEANDTPVWSVTADPARVAEGQASTVTVSVDKAFDTAQTIMLAAGGTAAGSDYSLSSSSLTLHAGDTSVTATVTAVDDGVIEGGDETVVVTAAHDGGAVGSATVTVEDNDTATWSVTAEPARVVEGAESTITVSAGKAFAVDQTIMLAAGGTAAGSDYSLSSSSLTLHAGATSVTASVTAVGDGVIEGGDETVVVTAAHSGGAVGSATVTVEDNDTPTWSVTAEPARVVEGAESTITVSAGKAFAVDQTIMLVAGGTAAGSDYSLSSSSLTLHAGATSVTASVTAVGDGVIEGGDETVVVTASHSGDAVGSATVTVEDNDTPTWSVTAEPARVAEGAESTITVSAGKAFEVDQTITLAAGGTAAGSDYSLSSSSSTLHAGDTSVTATVTAVDDSDEEGDETVVVTASHGGAVGSATVTIEANDTPVWSVTADPARVAEGQASTVTVSVDKAFDTAQTIMLAAGGTAAGSDYSLSSSSLTLHAGDTSVTATVTAVDDGVIEGGDETVVVTAAHDGGAVGSATVTVEDNDTATWSVTAEPARVVEGAESTITVSAGKAFAVDQTIMLAAGGTAAGSDYSLSSSSLTLHAGATSVTASVTAVGDGVIEGGDETVVVTAAHSGGAVGSATVTVEDNDTPTWSVTAEPARVVEGAESTITVSAGKAFAVDQTIMLVAGGTAAGSDYSLSSSSLTLHAGATSVTASVTAVGDGVIEGGDETVVVTASHSGDAVGSATVTVEDNDTPTWSVTAEPARVAEGAESTITVSAGKAFAVAQTITLAAGGTAAGSDYSLSSSSSTLHAGDTSVTATVTAVDDSDEEGDETVVVTASHGGAVGSATVTIEDNDTPVSTVAALSSLALSGVSIGVFDADTTAYAASVGNGVSSTTVTAVASDDGASVVIADGDGETQGTSRSVSLVVGDNEITVTVTAEDAATAKTYTITVTRAVAPLPPGAVWGDRLADRDIALPAAPSGVWSNGTDVWVLTAAGRISVYSLADGAEHTDRGFALPGGAEYAAGLWSNGATLWVADVNRGWVRAYRLSDGARQADRDLDTAALAAAGNTEPAGIRSNGTTMWVADFADSRVYAYDLTTKARVADKELDLDKNPGETYNPFGIWSNGDTLLAASWFRGQIIAHSLADGQRQPAKDLSTFASRTNFPNGIWSNGHILWVVDASAATLYAYAVPGLGAPPNHTAGSGN